MTNKYYKTLRQRTSFSLLTFHVDHDGPSKRLGRLLRPEECDITTVFSSLSFLQVMNENPDLRPPRVMFIYVTRGIAAGGKALVCKWVDVGHNRRVPGEKHCQRQELHIRAQ